MGNKKQVVVLIFLILILGCVVWFLVLGKSLPSFKKEMSGQPVAEHLGGADVEKITTGIGDLNIAAEQVSDTLAALRKREEATAFTYRSRGRRDPMVPLISEKKAAGEKAGIPGVSLTGIVWDKYCPLAIVNDEVVKSGDVVKEVKILRIEPDRLVVFYNSEEVIIELHDEEEVSPRS